VKFGRLRRSQFANFARRSSTYHYIGTSSMGKVVDTELRVKGVNNLRVVDASVFPVVIAAHLQQAVYALSEQAAVIIAKDLQE
jgi:choline dehydrogenase-like flavoprotein